MCHFLLVFMNNAFYVQYLTYPMSVTRLAQPIHLNLIIQISINEDLRQKKVCQI